MAYFLHWIPMRIFPSSSNRMDYFFKTGGMYSGVQMSVFDWRGPSQIAQKLQNDALAATKSKSGWKADGGRFYGISTKADSMVRKFQKENPQPVKTAGQGSQQREQETNG
jgi:hypothetical protein